MRHQVLKRELFLIVAFAAVMVLMFIVYGSVDVSAAGIYDGAEDIQPFTQKECNISEPGSVVVYRFTAPESEIYKFYSLRIEGAENGLPEADLLVYDAQRVRLLSMSGSTRPPA